MDVAGQDGHHVLPGQYGAQLRIVPHHEEWQHVHFLGDRRMMNHDHVPSGAGCASSAASQESWVASISPLGESGR